MLPICQILGSNLRGYWIKYHQNYPNFDTQIYIISLMSMANSFSLCYLPYFDNAMIN